MPSYKRRSRWISSPKTEEKRRRGAAVLCGRTATPAIIDPAEWKLVQRELERKESHRAQLQRNSIFSSRLVCGDCGGYFGSKVWHSTDKYRRTIWRCNSKFIGEEKCQTPHLTEEEIKARFLDAFNALVSDKERLLDECRTMQAALTDTGSLDSEISALLSEMEVVAELTSGASKRIPPRHRTRPLTGTVQRPGRTVRNRQGQAGEAPGGKGPAGSQGRGHRRLYVRVGGVRRTITEFDDRLWLTVIDIVTVHRDGRLTFKFQTGHEMLE